MKKTSIIWLVVVIIVVVVAGYFWISSMSSAPVTTTQTPTSTAPTNPSTNPTTGTTGATAPQPTTGATLTLTNSGAGIYGSYLTASNGMTLYQSTKDADDVSNCVGTCATTWPPYTVSVSAAATLTADPGITGAIGTMKRADGSLQVTYRGLPLYFYSGDTAPGDTKGEAVNGFTEVAP